MMEHPRFFFTINVLDQINIGSLAKMKLYLKKNNIITPVFAGGAQEFVDCEDYMLAISKHVKPSGKIKHMFIEFENTKIPVTDKSEIRVLSQMAAAYHNACLAHNLQYERDLYGLLYSKQEIQQTLETPEITEKLEQSEKREENRGNRHTEKPKSYKPNVQKRKKDRDSPSTKDWAEELHGARLVYDENYQLNEALVPWLMDARAWEDKYGLY
jgi:hypothetical protein